MATASYSMYYRMMPPYQRENIRRQLGDIAGVAFALLATAIIRAGIDKDEPDEDQCYDPVKDHLPRCQAGKPGFQRDLGCFHCVPPQ